MNETEKHASAAGDSPPILSYQSSALRPGKLVTVGNYPDAVYASMDSARLTAEGIDNHVLNANVNGLGMPYSGISSVELQVHESDVESARGVLRLGVEDMEPADDAGDTPIMDDEGNAIVLAVAGRFDKVGLMRDAMTVLASSHIRAFPPKLVKRGEAEPGVGKRFILRVSEDDLSRAHALLSQAEAESLEDDEPRCPKCNSWRIYPVSRGGKMFLAFFGIGKIPPIQTECLACRYRGAPEEFER